jgi:hypothetical protein
LEEEPNNENLQSGHGNHHEAFNDAEVPDSAFRRPHGTEVAVLACSEVLLVTGDGGQLRGKLENRLFDRGGLFRVRALTGWELGAGFVFKLQQKRR